MGNPTRIRARELRKESTWAEKRLWRSLRSRRLSGYKFRREHPAGSYFLDFYCIEARVAVESDGFQHGFPDQQAYSWPPWNSTRPVTWKNGVPILFHPDTALLFSGYGKLHFNEYNHGSDW